MSQNQTPIPAFEDFILLLRHAANPKAMQAQVEEWHAAREKLITAQRDSERLSRIDAVETQTKANLRESESIVAAAKQRAAEVLAESRRTCAQATEQLSIERQKLVAEKRQAEAEIARLRAEAEHLRAQATSLHQGLQEKQRELLAAEAAASAVKADYEDRLSQLRRALRE